MVLIISDEYDLSTSQVIEYLNYYNIKTIRINPKDKLVLNSGIISNEKIDFHFTLNDKIEFNISEIHFYWYRRGSIIIHLEKESVSIPDIGWYLIKEYSKFEEFLNYFLRGKPSLGNIKNVGINKLKVLVTAQQNGLNIPQTIFVSEKKQIPQNSRYISKGIFSTINLKYKNKEFIGLTKEITKNTINLLPDTFVLSMIQNRIEKKYEIRTFYLEGKFFSMAIFSQNNDKTKEDFRDYDNQNPNRVIPYNLSSDIEKKLINIFTQLNIKTCSCDLIKDINDKIIFLEINPVGQFGMTSYPCNYYLEKEIANYIKNKIYEKNFN